MSHKIETAKNPKYNRDGSIDLLVKFEGADDEVWYTASSNDTEHHSQELYNNSINGDYGDIAEYVEPSKVWSEVDRLQNKLIEEIMPRVSRYMTQEALGITPKETPEKYQEMLQYLQDIRDNDETLHSNPDDAIAALEGLVKP